VPKKVVEKRFAKQIQEELFSALINTGCEEAIKQEDLKVISVNVSEEPKLADSGELAYSLNFKSVSLNSTTLSVSSQMVTSL